jgi:chromosomal replication initiator protein
MRSEAPFPWDALLRAVRADYPDAYRAWFDELPAPRLRAGELTVQVADRSRAAYLREHCTQPFVNAAMALTGHLVAVRFVAPDAPDGVVAQSPPPLSRLALNPDYLFDHFVVGPSNRLPHAACRGVCGQPGSLYNPLFIHGPSGLGKTHLLQATCAELLRSDPGREVVYVSCETFVNDLIRAIETGSLLAFRDAARRVDVLVIDDVQFLANRESSQEELFHTFNTLYQARKQIILSADSSPAQIPTLEDRLVSRFNWGLVAQIDPPNRETRQAILQKKARLRGCEIPDDVLDLIAERVEANIRLLEGALTKLITEAQVNGKPLTAETARQILDGFSVPGRPPLQIRDILEAISDHYSVKLSELVGRKRTRSIAYPRQVGMYLARMLTPLSLEEIGAHFGGRDHSTVLHAERVIEAERSRDKEIAGTLAQLTKRLLARS